MIKFAKICICTYSKIHDIRKYERERISLINMAFTFLFDLEFSHSLSRQRVFRDRLNPIDVYGDIEFIARYRITKCIFVQLQEQVVTFIHRSTTRSHSISASTQLAVALQFLATGSFQIVVATSHGIAQPSVSRCIGTVT